MNTPIITTRFTTRFVAGNLLDGGNCSSRIIYYMTSQHCINCLLYTRVSIATFAAHMQLKARHSSFGSTFARCWSSLSSVSAALALRRCSSYPYRSLALHFQSLALLPDRDNVVSVL